MCIETLSEAVKSGLFVLLLILPRPSLSGLSEPPVIQAMVSSLISRIVTRPCCWTGISVNACLQGIVLGFPIAR